MCATFDSKPSTTINTCCSPINARDEIYIIPFYKGLSSLAWYMFEWLVETGTLKYAWHISKYNILIIGRDMNTQIGNNRNIKFC